MHVLLAQLQPTYSYDTGVVMVACIAAVLCGGVIAIVRRRPMGAIACAILSLMLASYIPASRLYDPEFVAVSVTLLISGCVCCTVSAVRQLGHRPRPEV